MSWIETYTGRAFDLLDPRHEQIDITDIAHALANIARFTGHTREFYSVAQHSVHVAELVPEPMRLGALLHDATEAYANDVASPLKRLLPEYQLIEKRIGSAIARRFGIQEPLGPEVKHADLVMLVTERRDLMRASGRRWDPVLEAIVPAPFTVTPWGHDMARQRFLEAFHRYGRERAARRGGHQHPVLARSG